MQLSIVSVNVGGPQVLRKLKTKTIYSSIDKHPVVSSKELLLTYTNLAGDQQVDTKPKELGRQLHGGNEKAVYVYPATHYGTWRKELGLDLPVPSFGENLTLDGIAEDEVHIGDMWQWGEALFEVSKPRQPCYKLKWQLGVEDIEDLMWTNGRCGWYLRVLTPGIVPTSGNVEVIYKNTHAMTVVDALREKEKKNRKSQS